MKRILLFALISISMTSFACKKEEKEKTPEKVEKKAEKTEKKEAPKKKSFTLMGDTAAVKWTAYKTSEKKPVGGVFNTVKVDKIHAAPNAMEALDGLAFSIPVASIFSKNEGRDKKLKESFFGTMTDTTEIKGNLVTKSGKEAFVNLTMNGITSKLPVTLKIDGEKVNLTAKLDLKTWKGSAAIAALNVVCAEKHKAKDGKSVTWDEVAIEVSGTFKIQ